MAIPNDQKYRVNQEPRISANQLAEYTLASPTRRQSILRNAKFSPTFLVIRYSEARRAICEYLADDARPLAKLIQAENEQIALSKGGGTAFAQNDALLSSEAIRAFRLLVTNNKIPKTVVFTDNTSKLPKFPICDVDVSINLDLVVRNNGNGLIGGAIIQTSKAVASKSWRDEHSKSVASLVWMLADKHLKNIGKVDRKLCLSIDLFGGSITPAPNNYKRKLNDIEASCSEIAALWDKITPPSDFEG